MLNGTTQGKVWSRTLKWSDADSLRSHKLWPAWEQVHQSVLQHAVLLAQARREATLTGVQAVSELSHSVPGATYGEWAPRGCLHEEMRALAIDEPGDDSVVDMLDALDPLESAYYAEESQVLAWSGKSEVMFHELELAYGFVGGSLEEYVGYYHRRDLPSGMWP